MVFFSIGLPTVSANQNVGHCKEIGFLVGFLSCPAASRAAAKSFFFFFFFWGGGGVI